MERVCREDRDGLCTLTLNRPEKLNALDTGTFRELDAHLAAIEKQVDEIGCVVIRGAGRAFCAGMDLTVVTREVEPPEFKPTVIERLAALPQPVIAAVRGACYTGGLELALAADFIIADPTARFADTHGKWGLVANWGLFQRLPRRVGQSLAMRMAMTACVVDGAEAKAIRLADELAPEGELDAVVADLASKVLANSWHVNFAAKRIVRETDNLELSQALAHERRTFPGHAPDLDARLERFAKKAAKP